MTMIPAARAVKWAIRKAGPGQFWTLGDFPDFPPARVAQALARLHAEGRLRRYGRGLYYEPMMTIIGEAPPPAFEIARKLAKGDRLVLASISAYNRLGLTTQIPARPVVATRRNLGTDQVEVIIRDLDRYGEATDEALMVLDALGHINTIPDCPPKKAIERLCLLLKTRYLAGVTPDELACLAMKDRPGVRGMVGLLGDMVGGLSETWRQRLQASLNPLTKFKINRLDDIVPLELRREWHFV